MQTILKVHVATLIYGTRALPSLSPAQLSMVVLEISSYAITVFGGSEILCFPWNKNVTAGDRPYFSVRNIHIGFTVQSRIMTCAWAMCPLVYKAFEANRPFLLEQKDSYSFITSNKCSFPP